MFKNGACTNTKKVGMRLPDMIARETTAIKRQRLATGAVRPICAGRSLGDVGLILEQVDLQ